MAETIDASGCNTQHECAREADEESKLKEKSDGTHVAVRVSCDSSNALPTVHAGALRQGVMQCLTVMVRD